MALSAAATLASAAPPLCDPLRGPVRELPRPARGVGAQRSHACPQVHQRRLEAERHPGGHRESRAYPLHGQGLRFEEPWDGVAVEVGHDLD